MNCWKELLRVTNHGFLPMTQESKRQSMHWKSPTETMNMLTENDLKHCFELWKIRMEKCRDSGGEYIEGDKVKVVKEKKLKELH